jgi:basic amino acid/polyamine antiporter, APA family
MASSSSSTTGGGTATGMFTRRATGLLRDVPVLDQFLFLLFVVNLGLGPILVFEVGPAVAPNGSLILAMILGGAGFVALGVVYALFTSSMPRTGGDYVFLTRLVSPPIGFLGSWMLVVTFVTVGTAGAAYFWAHFVVPFSFYGFAKAFNSSTMMSWSTWFASNTGTWIVSIGVILAGAGLLIAGMRAYIVQQRWSFFIGIVGVIAALIVLATTSQSSFAHSFGQISGNPHAYQAVTKTAFANGLAPYHFSFDQTIGLFAMVMQAVSFCVATTWFAGELRGARQVRNTILTMAGSAVVMIVFCVILAVLLYGMVGHNWLNAIVFNYGNGHYNLPWDPNYGFLTVIATSNKVVLVLIGVSFMVWSAQWVFMNMLWPIRILFAWSFDRLVPEQLADVNPRTHTPVKATLLVTVIALISTWLAQTGQILGYFLAGAFLEAIVFTVVSIVAVFYPFVRREAYTTSRMNVSVLGMPLLTIAGIGALIVNALAVWQFITWDGYGVNAHGPMTWSVITIVTGIPVYYALKLWNRSRGLDVGLVYAELPPE